MYPLRFRYSTPAQRGPASTLPAAVITAVSTVGGAAPTAVASIFWVVFTARDRLPATSLYAAIAGAAAPVATSASYRFQPVGANGAPMLESHARTVAITLIVTRLVAAVF